MPLLTPGEYDDLPQGVKDQLAGIHRQPHKDVKDRLYGRKKGKYMNGKIEADPTAQQVVGYGTGSPKAPHYP